MTERIRNQKMNQIVDGIVYFIQKWKESTEGSKQAVPPDFYMDKLKHCEPGILGLAVQAAIDRGIISEDEAEQIL